MGVATILASDEELDITLAGIDPELDPQVRSYSLEEGIEVGLRWGMTAFVDIKVGR
ncbi:MAG: hypothetical protein ACE5MB_08625 [Anaerolineae bacterium]